MRILILLLSLLVMSPQAWADDAGAARGVITSQIEAIGRGDADAAYSFASPTIQDIFPAPDVFLGMVRRLYAPLYRPNRFELGQAVAADGKIAQRAHIVDSDGVAWEALYTLERQPDGGLKISGCTLIKADQGA